MNQDIKKQRLSTGIKWALAGAAALVISPIIFFVVKGIIGLAIAAVVGSAVVSFAPVWSMKLSNWKIKGIKSEAAANPIETLENLMIAKRQAFREFKEAVTDSVRARDDFKTKVDQFTRQWPARAPEFQAQLQRLVSMVEKKKQALNDAEEQLKQGDLKLAEMRAYWDMSQAAIAANRAAGMDTGDLYEKMKADTAVDAVYSSINQAFAELEVQASLDEGSVPPALVHQPVDVLEIPLNLKTKVRQQ